VAARFTLEATGRPPVPGRELLSGGAPCYAVYRCADGRFMAVGSLEPKFWQATCAVLGHPEWSARHWSQGLVPGSAASMALRTEVAAVFASQPMAHWATRFESVDACVTPVLRLDELQHHPVHRGAEIRP
jgi:alpha-methylacyl-CoA racemase